MKKEDIIYNFITENIKKGIYRPGDRLPTNRELAKICKVSYITISKAISRLADKGVLNVRPRVGIFVSERKQKLIFISIYKNDVFGVKNNFRIAYLNKIKNIISQRGDRFYVHTVDYDQSVEIPKMNPDCYLDLVDIINFEREEAPIISVINNVPEKYPAVIVNYYNFIGIIDNLIKKYKLNNPYIFSLASEKLESQHKSSFIQYAIKKYFDSKFYQRGVTVTNNMEKAPGEFKHFLSIMREMPDSLIFLDDTIFKSCFSIIPEYLLKKVKIITHSNEDIEYDPDLKICRVVFDVNEMVDKSLQLMDTLMSGNLPVETVLYVNPYVINEDKLI